MVAICMSVIKELKHLGINSIKKITFVVSREN